MDYPVLCFVDSPRLSRALRDSPVGVVLEYEGMANDLVFHINRLRRERDYGVSDVIDIVVACGEELWWAIHWNRDEILKRTKAEDLTFTLDFERDLYYTGSVGSAQTPIPFALHSRLR